MPPRRRAHAPVDVAMDEPEVAALTQAQRDRLLRAFEKAGQRPVSMPASPSAPRMKKRRKVGVVESPSASEGGGGFLPVEADGTGGGFLTADDDVHGVGGGFVVEDNDMDGGGSGGSFISADNEAVVGGFIVDSPSSNADVEAIDDAADEPTPRTRTHLPLSLVSAALRLAGLPPSDPEVLEFLRQSAEGWADKDSDDEAEVRSDGRDSRRGVSRQDWMSVCAVLLASRAGEDEAESQFADSDDHRSSSLTEPDDDEYCDDADDVEADINNPAQRRTRQTIRSAARLSPVPSLPPDDSDDANSDADGFQQSVSDQIERTGRKTANAAKRSKASRGLLDTSSGRPELSRSEKRVAREAFALFFPSSARPAVDESILTVGMVAAAVKDLKETQISMDLVKEMVQLYSSTTGKTGLTLANFETLMWEGNLFHLLAG